MKLKNPGAQIYIPDGVSIDQAINRTTHLGIGAHQDDLEIAAYHGIMKCYNSDKDWFFGIIVTDGSGSPREGKYASCSDQEISNIRNEEQKKAAVIGKYSGVALLDYPGSIVRNHAINDAGAELKKIISTARPQVVYTHNPVDKHATHVAVVLRVIRALREMPEDLRPLKVYGCEVWRSLDWLDEIDKIALDVSSNPDLAAALIKVHDSQVSGGKRYDLATEGRRMANATYSDAFKTDRATSVIYAMDLTPLIKNVSVDIKDFVQQLITRFSNDVISRL